MDVSPIFRNLNRVLFCSTIMLPYFVGFFFILNNKTFLNNKTYALRIEAKNLDS